MDALGDRDGAQDRQEDDHRRDQSQAQSEAEQHDPLGPGDDLDDMPAAKMLKLIREKSELLEIDRKFLSRSLNQGFSGGEKKRNEIFQMAVLEPKLAILDETDSGLDIDAMRIVANGVNTLKSKNNAIILITHYQRLLDYIVPDFVHVVYDGKIVKSGTKELALELEEKGYDWIKEEVNA